MSSKQRHIGFLLTEGFSMIAFSNAIETFRMANYTTKEHLYHFSVVGLVGDSTKASNHIGIEHSTSSENLALCDIVFVCGGFDVSKLRSPELRSCLQKLAAKGIHLGGICTGAYALADAKLLDGHQASIHWENMLVAKEDFPAVYFVTSIYSVDQQRYTCSGGSAPLDLCLNLIKSHHGRALAESIAEFFTLTVLRDGSEPQHIPLPKEYNNGYNYVIEALSLMDKNLEDPLPIHELSGLLGISVRQLERWFGTYFGMPPKQYYAELRLKHAKRLLQQTNMSIMNVALACGFSNSSSFTKAYRNQFQLTPTQTRKVGLH